MRHTKSPIVVVGLVFVFWVSAAGLEAANNSQESTSRSAVAKLTTFLASHGLDSIAVEDPSRAGHLVAVLHIPKVQLLVIAGQCGSIDSLRARLTAKAYRDVYTDLQACADADSRLFIQDLGADGLLPERTGDGAPFDIVYEHMTRQTRFDGNFKAQDISEAEYRERFAAIDAEYARLAALLVAGSADQ